MLVGQDPPQMHINVSRDKYDNYTIHLSSHLQGRQSTYFAGLVAQTSYSGSSSLHPRQMYSPPKSIRILQSASQCIESGNKIMASAKQWKILLPKK